MGAVPLLPGFLENNLAETISKIGLLLESVMRFPITFCLAERCLIYEESKKIFCGAMSENRCNALVILSLEKSFIRDSADFIQILIDVLIQLKSRRDKFLYK